MAEIDPKPRVLLVSRDQKFVESLTQNNTTDFEIHFERAMQTVLRQPDKLNGTGIVIFDLDSVEGNVDEAISAALNLKHIDPTQVLLLAGAHDVLAEVLKSPIQALSYRAFNKPISPNQVFLSFKSANSLHLELIERQLAGEDISVVGPIENKTSVQSLSGQRESKSAVYITLGMVALMMAITFLVNRKDDAEAPAELTEAVAEKIESPSTEPISNSDQPGVSVSEVNRLNQKAATAILESKLISPANDNALYYYNQVLALDPYDTSAYRGKKALADRIRESYQPLVRNARFNDAFDAINALKSIEPLNQDNDILRQNLEAAIAEHVKTIRESGSAEDISRTSDELGRLESKLDSTKTASIALSKEKQLLAEIDAALVSNNLSPPNQSNAYILVSSAVANNSISRANITPRLLSLSNKLAQQAQQELNAEKFDEAKKLASLMTQLDAQTKKASELTKAITDKLASSIEGKKTEPKKDKIRPASIISQKGPRYPTRAQNRELEGWVSVSFVVDKTGKTRNIRIVDTSRGGSIFESAAIKAVKTWRFSPAQNERTLQAVESRIDATKVTFKLE